MDSFSFPPYALAYLINFFLTIFIVVVALRRRHAQGALAFAGVISTAIIWSFAQIFESGATTVESRVFWSQVQYIGATMVSPAWFIFAIRYSGLRFLEGRRIAVLFIIPVITLALVWTNPLHGLIWTDIRIIDDGPILLATYDHGLWFWIHILYSYVLVITGSVLLIRESIYAPQLRQYQTLALVAGAVAPLIANVMYLLELTPLPGLDLTAFAFTVTGLLYLPALYNLHVLDITPVARGAIIDQMSDSVIVTDMQHRIVDVNAATSELLGADISDWIGQPLAEALSAFPELAALGADGQQTQAIITTITPARSLDVRQTVLNDRYNNPIGTLFLLRDITQFRLAEQQSFDLALEHERVRLLSRFIRDASHEFRTPLAVINTSLYLMGRSPDASVQSAQQEKIEAQVKRIGGLLDDMLTMSRLDEREPLTLTDVDLNALIHEVTEAERNQAIRQPTINLQLAPTLPAVRGDKAQLRRVIENLLRNALDYTHCEGTITLSSRERGDFIIFSLSDTGAGMDAAAQRHVFERFFRSDEAHSTPGLGLGLPITRAIVEAHGGLIEAVSASGKGSTFTVQLPAQPPASVPDKPAAPYRLNTPLLPRSGPAIETP